MDRDQMFRLFTAHRAAEAARDVPSILATFTEDCFLDTVPLGLRSQGKPATRAAYESLFAAFPDLAPEDTGIAYGDDVLVVWGTLQGTSRGQWLGLPPGGGAFTVPFANVVPFRNDLMAGETLYFDLASVCAQAGLDLDHLRTAAAAAAASAGPPKAAP
ncbi:ester cyclase [Streptomyces sp. NPDC097981]|uniref:ester cyclase n=1 Tax=Streptomyces sp. NPDC097981 TaxID=3155428 RepID=UPI00332DD3BF